MLKQQPMLHNTRSNWYQVHAQVNKVKSHFIQSARDNIAEQYDRRRFESASEHVEYIDYLPPDIRYLCPVADHVGVGVCGPNAMQRVSKDGNQWPVSIYFLAEEILWLIYVKLNHPANNHPNYADGFYNCKIDDNDSHIQSPRNIFTCTALRHALLEWQRDKGIHPKDSKSKLKADQPDRTRYFNYKNDGGKNTSSCTAIGHKFLTSPGVAETYTFSMDTWNTLPESYQQTVYNNTLASVRRQIQQVENPTPAVEISVEAAPVDNAIIHD